MKTSTVTHLLFGKKQKKNPKHLKVKVCAAAHASRPDVLPVGGALVHVR